MLEKDRSAAKRWIVNKPLFLSLVTAACLSPGSFAGSEVRVTMEPDFLDGVRTIAVLPTVDNTGEEVCSGFWGNSKESRTRSACHKIDRKLAKALSQGDTPTIVSASTVREAMLANQITAIEERESRLRLAEIVGAQAFLIPLVQESGMEIGSGPGIPVPDPHNHGNAGAIRWVSTGQPATAHVELLLVSAESGERLMRGTGRGEALVSTERSAAGKALAMIVRDAFGGPGQR